jgi:hypothetical protein
MGSLNNCILNVKSGREKSQTSEPGLAGFKNYRDFGDVSEASLHSTV